MNRENLLAEGGPFALDSSLRVPLAGSRKIYVEAAGGVRVPMREIDLPGDKEGRLWIYDTSGPYTDPAAAIDLTRGLPPLR